MEKKFDNYRIESSIFEAFDAGKTLVFPREVSARSYLSLYSKVMGKAVFADRAISYDVFIEKFKAIPADKNKASVTNRYLFVNMLFQSEKVKELKYFVNSDFETSSEAYKKSIVNNLPYFKRFINDNSLNSGLPKELDNDIQILFSEYNNYLSDNNLYESEYIEPNFDSSEKGKYVLVFPSSVDDPSVSRVLIAKNQNGERIFDVIDVDTDGNRLAAGWPSTDRTNDVSQEDNQKGFVLPDELNRISVYENSLAEIKSRVREIYRLTTRGVKCRDIIVTLNQADSYLPHFVSECSIRGIPINIQKGKKLAEYNIGKFFADIRAIYVTDFDFSSLKKFLLNPAYKFKDTDLVSKLVRFAIDNRVDATYDLWEEKLGKAKDFFSKNGETGEIDSLRSLFVQLHDFVKMINQGNTVEKVKGAFHSLRHRFFDSSENVDGEMFSSQIENKAMERALVVLEDMEKALEDCRMTRVKDVFGLYLTLLSVTSYTPDMHNGGIKVYSYPQTKGVYSPYHFVLGLSDDEIQQERKGRSFTHDLENKAESISDAVLKSYAFKSPSKVYLSCAIKNFDAVSTEPSLFIEKELIDFVGCCEEDSFKTEERLWFSGIENAFGVEKIEIESAKPSSNQRKWFKDCEKRLEKSTKDNSYPEIRLPLSISSSSLENYQKCPYRWYCAYNYRPQDLEYKIAMRDGREIGNLLHDTFETFFREAGNFGIFLSKKERFGQIYLQNIAKMKYRLNAPDDIHLLELELKKDDYLNGMNIPDSPKNDDGFCVLKDYSTEEIEKKLSLERGNYRIDGRVDLIMKNPEGNYAVIDFKTNRETSDSFQLVIYAALLKNNPNYGKIPVASFYYRIKEGKFKTGWTETDCDTEYLLKEEELKALIEDVLNSVKDRNFEPKIKKESCNNCNYRRICRKRFVIK